MHTCGFIDPFFLSLQVRPVAPALTKLNYRELLRVSTDQMLFAVAD